MQYVVTSYHFKTDKTCISKVYNSNNKNYAYEYTQKRNRLSSKLYRVIEIDLLSTLNEKGLI